MPHVHHRRLVAALVAATAVVAMGAATPAAAHPFGPPLSARLDVDGAEVAVTWTAAEDDWVNLGEFLGAFTGQAGGAGSGGTGSTSGSSGSDSGEQLTGAELLARSDNLPSYLLSHFVVEQDGQPCEGQVTQLEDLLTLGAGMVYTCPRPVATVQLTVTTLTDINENYRTVVTSDDASEPAQALFTNTTATQKWNFDATATGLGTARVALMATGGLILAALAGVLLWWRRSCARPAAAADERAAASTVGAAR